MGLASVCVLPKINIIVLGWEFFELSPKGNTIMRNARRSTVSLNLESLDERITPASLYALTNSQRLITFDSNNPAVILRGVTLTGTLNPGEIITDIDVRVTNNALYGRSSLGRIYLIDPTTGGMAAISGHIAVGASIGMSFDPLTDLLREVNYGGRNVGINVSTGTVAVVGSPLTYQSGDPFQGQIPRLSSLSFTNSVPLALSTQLYAIDSARNTLALGVGDPNAGQFSTVGSLNVDVTNNAGLAIDPITRFAYVVVQVAGQSNSLYGQINLATGAATLTRGIGAFSPLVLDLAVAPILASLSIAPALTASSGVPAEPIIAPPPPIDEPFIPTAPALPPSVPPFATFGPTIPAAPQSATGTDPFDSEFP